MHNAPSVIYPVGRSRYASRLLWTLWGCGAAGALLACVQAPDFGWRSGLLLSSALAAAMAVRRGLARQDEAVVLDFDGRRWSLGGRAARAAAVARVSLDLQSLLLVSLDEPGRPARWLWLDRQASPAHWDDLRRALYSQPSMAAAPTEPAVPQPTRP